MRRSYAFEADVSTAVQTQLEKVEDKVEEKCTTAEACDKMLEKIDSEKEKFDDALQTMADKAKDCQDGKCDKAEMAAVITPKMAELKEVAKSIGVASEGDTLTEAELKDARDYLNGAEEIVEAKKDELENGSADGSKKEDKPCDGDDCDGDDDDDDDDEDEGEDIADESFIASESFLDELDTACESAMFELAMEGTNIDAVKALRDAMGKIRAENKAMKSAAKSKNFDGAANAARNAAAAAQELSSKADSLPASAASAAIVDVAVALTMIAATVGAGAAIGAATKNGAGVKAAMKANKDFAAKTGNTLAEAGGNDFALDTMKNAKAAGMKGRMKLATLIGAGAGGAGVAGVGTLETVKALKKAKAVDADGKVSHNINPNDVNLLISAVKLTAKRLADKYNKLASKYAAMKSAGAAESALCAFSDADEAFDAMEAALDDMTVDAACEGVTIDAIKQNRALLKKVKELKREFNDLYKTESYTEAAKKATEIAGVIAETRSNIDNLPKSIGSAALVAFASSIPLAILGGITGGLTAAGAGKAAVAGVAAYGAAGGALTGTAATMGSSAIGRALNKVVDKKSRYSSGDKKEIDANDLNIVIAAIRSDLNNAISIWKKIAKKCQDMATRTKNRQTRYAGNESEMFSGFIDACEGFKFNTEKAPYLF